MGNPRVVGSILASVAIDAASFVWSQWQTVPDTIGAERWNINVCGGATVATVWMDIAYSSTGTVYATGTLKTNASIVIAAHEGFSVDAIPGLYYNFQFGATSTIKSFYVVASGNDAAFQ